MRMAVAFIPVLLMMAVGYSLFIIMVASDYISEWCDIGVSWLDEKLGDLEEWANDD